MNDLRSQLAPGWSGVNIALTVVLFVLAWPLGLLMIAYIVWGRQLGLDFSRPETLSAFGARLGNAWRAATDTWKGGPSLSTGTPDRGASNGMSGAGARTVGDGSTSASDETLRREREILDRERQAFETEKREWRERREPLDS